MLPDVIRSSANDLRAKGLSILSHYEFPQDGGYHVRWLIGCRLDDGVLHTLIGEAETDAKALDQIRAQYAKLTDNLDHDPSCPANHYDGQRAPTGPCACNAKEMSRREEYDAIC